MMVMFCLKHDWEYGRNAQNRPPMKYQCPYCEVERLRAVLEDIADGMGEMTHKEIGRYAPAVARNALAKVVEGKK